MIQTSKRTAAPDFRHRRSDGKLTRQKPSTNPQLPASKPHLPPLPVNEAEGPNRTLAPVVVIVSVAGALVVVESSTTDAGLSEQPIFAVEEERLQKRLTVPVNPPVAWTVTVEVPDCPAETFTLVGLARTE